MGSSRMTELARHFCTIAAWAMGRAREAVGVGQVSAAVLAGGYSRRMGSDKAMLEVGGLPLLGRVLAVLNQLSDDVYVVGERPAYHDFGAPVVADAYVSAGTLGGIATALRTAKHEYLVAVACDMPFLSLPLLQAIAAEADDVDVVMPVLTGHRSQRDHCATLEPLHAVYSRRCLPATQRCIAAGRLKATAFLDEVRVRRLDESWLRRFDPELRSFWNANTVAELGAARRLVEAELGMSF